MAKKGSSPPPRALARALRTNTEILSLLDKMIEEEDGTLLPAVVDAFKAKVAAQRIGVDDCIESLWRLSSMIEEARKWRAHFDALVQKFKSMKAAGEGGIKDVIVENPLTSFDGDLGSFKIQKNGGQDKLLLNHGHLDTKKKSFDDCVDSDRVWDLGIPAKYLKVVTINQLDKDAIRADLEAGIAIDWAMLERGSHLRYPKPPANGDKPNVIDAAAEPLEEQSA